MLTRRGSGLLNGGIGWGVACAVALGLLPAVAGGGNVASQRPAPRLSAGERNLVELGRRLFFEPVLSSGGRNSCSSCHEPEHGFGDARRFSPEDSGRTLRHSQSLIDVDLKADQHWDGEFRSVAAIVESRTRQTGSSAGYGDLGTTTPGRRAPREGAGDVFPVDLDDEPDAGDELTAERDLGLAKHVRIARARSADTDGAARVDTHGRYAEALASVPGPRTSAALDPALAGKAIEAYLGSVRSNRSPYDRYRAGEAEALSESALRGLGLFRGRAGCVACHTEEAAQGWPLFRDGEFHNNGVAWLSDRVSLRVPSLRGGGRLEVEPGPLLDEGRGRFMPEGAAQRAFKTPSLRDVARHPPYMHDGSKATLEEVVAHYAAGCGDDPHRDARLRGFEASAQDRQDLVAFLNALTSEERPGHVTEAWGRRAQRTRVRFLDAKGEPVVGFSIGLEEAGEKVPLPRAAPLPATVETDAKGEITYLVPASTHVRLRLPRGVEPEGGTLIPDTCKTTEIVLPLSGRLRLALILRDPAVTTPEELRAYEPTVLALGDDGMGGFEKMGIRVAFQRAPWTLARLGEVTLGTQRAVLYEGWRLGAGRRTLVFRLPGQLAPQQIELASEAGDGGEDATQRVDVTRAGSDEWQGSVADAVADAVVGPRR